MNIQIIEGLPIVSVKLIYKEREIIVDNILLDTGCSTTIFDTDVVEDVGLIIDYKSGRPRRMYGVGGESELCYEQIVREIEIDDFLLHSFQLQLGITRETYGFNGILGIDFMVQSGLIIDLKEKITKRK